MRTVKLFTIEEIKKDIEGRISAWNHELTEAKPEIKAAVLFELNLIRRSFISAYLDHQFKGDYKREKRKEFIQQLCADIKEHFEILEQNTPLSKTGVINTTFLGEQCAKGCKCVDCQNK